MDSFLHEFRQWFCMELIDYNQSMVSICLAHIVLQHHGNESAASSSRQFAFIGAISLN